MSLSRAFIALTMGLTLASTPALAAAPGPQSTKLSDQQVATLLFQQQGERAEIKAELAEVRRLIAAAKKANASRGPDPTAPVIDLAPLMTRQATLEGQLGAVSAQIAALQAAVDGKASKEDFDELVRWMNVNVARQGDLVALGNTVDVLVGRVDDLEGADTVLAGRVTALENASPPVATPSTAATTTVSASDSHPIVYAGIGVAITASYLPAYGTASGRLEMGARPAWGIGKGDAAEFALDLEGNWTPQIGVGSGFGVRALPSLVGSFDKADVGIGAGPSYDCSVLVLGAGCKAEHIGGLVRGTVLVGGAAGVRLHVDVEGNYLTVSPKPEVRTVIGVSFFGGRRHDTVVSSGTDASGEDSE